MNKEDKIKTIWVLYGIPASGKSTWAKMELLRNPGKYKRVNKDLLRLMLDDDRFDYQNEKFILKIRDRITESALNAGLDVIVDDTNFPVGGKHFLRMCEIAQKVGNVRVIEKYFDISLKEALERNGNSDRRAVPEDVVKKMFDTHIKNKSFECQDVFFQKTAKIPYDITLPDCVIFDVDGTLAHMNFNRGPFEWHNVDKDDPDENIVMLTTYFACSIDMPHIFIMTGRDGSALEKTKQWLDDVGVSYDDIFIRPAGDMRKDSIVKRELYENNIKGQYNVIAWFDDRNQVIDMLRGIGLTAIQVADGDF